jgi:hypothetical protein
VTDPELPADESSHEPTAPSSPRRLLDTPLAPAGVLVNPVPPPLRPAPVGITRAALTRGLAIALVSVPVAFLFASGSRDRLAAITADPAKYLVDQRATNHVGLLYNYWLAAFALGACSSSTLRPRC